MLQKDDVPVASQRIAQPTSRLLHCHSISSVQKYHDNILQKCFSAMQTRSFSLRTLEMEDLTSKDQQYFKEFFKSKGIEYQETHACLVLSIPRHLFTGGTADLTWDEVDESIVKVYLNRITGVFVSPEMAVGGHWNALEEFLKVWTDNRVLKKKAEKEQMPVLESILPKDARSIVGISDWLSAQPVDSIDNQEFKSVLKCLQLSTREFNKASFVSLEAKVKRSWDDKEKLVSAEVLFPVKYINGDLIAVRKLYFCSQSKTVKEETLGCPSNNPSNVTSFPHGLDTAYKLKTKKIVIVSSILDSIILTSKASDKSLMVPVALGEGALSLPPSQIPFLDEDTFEKVTFWFPNSPEALESIRTFSKKLGDYRCQMITRDFPQPWIWAKNEKENIFKFIESKARDCGHKYITTFENLRHDVLLELTHHEEIKGTKWKRFDKLNELLSGFRRGELTIFSGRTGAGKTTFLSEYSIDLCAQNVTTLWGSFEVKNTRLAKMQLKQFSGIHFEENLDMFDKWANRFQKLPLYYLTFHGAHEVRLY